jgi:uncharacterized protein involved in exopolysaccharide biosynthesis
MSTTSTVSAVAPAQELDLLELLAALRADWLRLFAVVTVASILSVVIALAIPDVYRASVVVAPAEEADSLGGLLGQSGQLAALAGFSLGIEKPVDPTSLALETLRSRGFFGEFVARRDVLVPLLATGHWDKETRELVVDPGLYDVAAQRWVREPEPGRTVEPTVLEAHEEFAEILEIERSGDTGIITISIEHASPQVAHDWLLWLVADLNERIRRKDIEEAERSIAFLEEQVRQTSVADLRAVLFQLIQSQTETMMLARVREEYVLETIDPPFVPEKKDRPHRALICIVGAFLGGVLGVAWVLLRYALRGRDE